MDQQVNKYIMKYEEIKVGDFYNIHLEKEKVIAKVDEDESVATVDDCGNIKGWYGRELEKFEPIKKELPEEGLLVAENGSLVYRLSDDLCYGFNRQGMYFCNSKWSFIQFPNTWKPATPEQKDKFIEMLKKECEARGLHEYTKIECHAGSDLKAENIGHFGVLKTPYFIDNNNGRIFSKGKFATPIKESTLDQVTDAVKNIADFTIEESPTGLIILTPINK